MSSVLKNFITRAVTGILFVLVVAAMFILGARTGALTFAAIMIAIIVLATHEYYRMLQAGGMSPHYLTAMCTNLTTFVLGFLVCKHILDYRFLLIIVGLVWVMFLVELFSNNKKPLENIALTMMGCVYIGLPFALFNLLAFKTGEYDYWPIIGMFALVWVNDTGAYLCGVTMGKHKLYERISPKKTIEGFIGGVLLTVAVGIVSYVCLGDCFFHAGLPFTIVATAVVAIIGTCGDLVESMFKRSVNIKDSGTILPGHGGILDRFDAVMFAAPIISLLYYFFT